MTTTRTPATHRAWLLSCADRLDREGDHTLANEARNEADTAQAPITPLTHLSCEDCGRPASIRKMPANWPLDWWSHKLNGRPCREAQSIN